MSYQVFNLIDESEIQTLEKRRFGYTLLCLDGVYYLGAARYSVLETFRLKKNQILIDLKDYDLEPVLPQGRAIPYCYTTSREQLKAFNLDVIEV